jgi:hypothetical protein
MQTMELTDKEVLKVLVNRKWRAIIDRRKRVFYFWSAWPFIGAIIMVFATGVWWEEEFKAMAIWQRAPITVCWAVIFFWPYIWFVWKDGQITKLTKGEMKQ